MESTLVIKRRHAVRDENDKMTGKYTLSVECLSGAVANTEINVDEEQNIISIEGFGDLSRFYDCYYTENITEYVENETIRECAMRGKIVEKRFELESYVQEIYLNGHQVFDIDWCSMVRKLSHKKFVRKLDDTEWIED